MPANGERKSVRFSANDPEQLAKANVSLAITHLQNARAHAGGAGWQELYEALDAEVAHLLVIQQGAERRA